MEPDSFALRTGLFVIVAGLLLAATVALFNRTQIDTRPYRIFTRDSVSGLDAQSRVYYKGVEVGIVERIEFAPDDYDTVRITIAVDRLIPLGENTYAQLVLRGITGEYDLTLNNDGELGTPLDGPDGEPPTIPMRSDYMAQLGQSLNGALDEFRGLAANLRALTADDNRERVAELLESLTTSSDRLAAMTTRIDRTLGDIEPAVAAFTRAMDGIDGAARSLQGETSGLDQLITSLDRSMVALTDLLSAAESETLNDLDDTLAALRTALIELTDLADSLQRDPQSLLLGQSLPAPGPGETVEVQ